MSDIKSVWPTNKCDCFALQILRVLLCSLGIAFIILMPLVSLAGTLEGVVFSETGPVKGATVFAYKSYEDLTSGHEFSKSEQGKRDGQYALNLPPGNYYLVAHATLNGQRFFSYHGVNPVNVTQEYRWLPFILVQENKITCQEESGQSRITGNATYKGHPISEGVASVYPWQDGKFRGMGLLTNTLDEHGRFSFELEPGSYVVIARKKHDIRGIGPVMPGDLFCYPSTNPIQLSTDQTCYIDINCYPRDDLKLYLNDDAVNPQGRRHDDRRQASFHDLQPAEAHQPSTTQQPTIISGIVTDPSGNPRAGMIVTAYPARGLELFQMHVLRLITGNMGQTDSDGRYKIELKDGDDKYYLIAREKVGEAPDRSEYYGLYEGSPNHSVTVEHGKNLSDINLIVDRIMPPQNTEKSCE